MQIFSNAVLDQSLKKLAACCNLATNSISIKSFLCLEEEEWGKFTSHLILVCSAELR